MSDDTEATMVREIQRETRERLDVLDLPRLDREEKRARENAVVDGANKVEYAEREWRKRRPETLPEIHATVDLMGSPREERLRVGERVFLPPEEELPPTRALTTVERQAIERHLSTKVVAASIVYRSARGHVVEVEHEREGRREHTLLSVLGERVRDLGDIRSRIDSLAPRASEAPPPAPEAVTPAEAAPEPTAVPALPVEEPTTVPAETPAPSAEPAAPATEAPSRKRFSIPKLGRRKADAPEPAPAAADEAPKKRFALPKIGKKEPEADAPPAEPAPPAEADAPKGVSRFLKRRK